MSKKPITQNQRKIIELETKLALCYKHMTALNRNACHIADQANESIRSFAYKVVSEESFSTLDIIDLSFDESIKLSRHVDDFNKAYEEALLIFTEEAI
jgi:hypothetical protein